MTQGASAWQRHSRLAWIRLLLFCRRWLFADGREQLAIRYDPAVDRHDSIDIDVQAPNVGFESDRKRIRNLGWFCAGRARVKSVGFDQDLFLAQIGHDNPIMMVVIE